MTMISRGQEVLISQPFAHVVALEGRETVCDGCMRMASEVRGSFIGCGVLGYLGQLLKRQFYFIFTSI